MYFTRIDSGYACMTNTGLLHYKQAGSFMPFWGKEGILPSPLSDFAKKKKSGLKYKKLREYWEIGRV